MHLLLYGLKTGLKEVENGDTNKKPALLPARACISPLTIVSYFEKRVKEIMMRSLQIVWEIQGLGARRDI